MPPVSGVGRVVGGSGTSSLKKKWRAPQMDVCGALQKSASIARVAQRNSGAIGREAQWKSSLIASALVSALVVSYQRTLVNALVRFRLCELNFAGICWLTGDRLTLNAKCVYSSATLILGRKMRTWTLARTSDSTRTLIKFT